MLIGSRARKFVFNSGVLLVEKIIRLVLSLFVGVWVARYLGPDYYGYIGFFTALYGILKVFSSFGLEQIIVKELFNDERTEDLIYNSYFAIKLINGLLINAFYAVFAFNSSDKLYLYGIPLVGTLLLQGLDYYEYRSQFHGNSKIPIFISVIALVLSSIVKIILIQQNSSVEFFILTLSVDFFVVLMGYWVLMRKWSIIQFNRINFAYIKSLLGQAWPIFAAAASVIIYLKIDTIMIFHMLGNTAAGYYTAATRISEIFYFIPTVISAGIFPLLIEKNRESQERYVDFSSLLIAFFLIVAVIIAIGSNFFGKMIIILIYGEDYLESVVVFLVHSLACIPVFIGVIFRKISVIENSHKITLYVTSIGLIVNVLLNLFFIKAFGIIGAAYATLISRLCGSVLLYFFFKQTVHYWTLLMGIFRRRTYSAIKFWQ